MITITKPEELRKQYKSKGFKGGTSLQLLVDEEKTMSYEQQQELRTKFSTTTVEEFLDIYYQSLREQKPIQFDTIKPNELEAMARSSEKYFTKDELTGFMRGGPKFSTGAWKP